MLALQGVPGIYFHSLFGSRGWPAGVQQTGRARTINRQKLALEQLEAELATAGSLRQRVFSGYRHLLQARAQTPAFHPHGSQQVIELHPAVFALWRTGREDSVPAVLCLHNVCGQAVTVEIPAGQFRDLLSGERLAGPAEVVLQPYGVLWLEEEENN
jgi:sucrose phosphorylase